MLKTKKLRIFGLLLSLIIICLLSLSQISFATEQPSIPKVELPLIVTTCGQSPGALMIWVLSKQIKLPCDRKDLLTAEDLKAKADESNPYKTLIITTGTSMKGMGAAGVDIDYEVARIEAIIEEAKKEGILIIGAHIEGMARRVDATIVTKMDISPKLPKNRVFPSLPLKKPWILLMSLKSYLVWRNRILPPNISAG